MRRLVLVLASVLMIRPAFSGLLLLNEQKVAQKYEVLYTLREGDNYLAVNPYSDPDAVQALRDALAEVKARDTYKEILAAYQ